jgi:hypothetical protein
MSAVNINSYIRDQIETISPQEIERLQLERLRARRSRRRSTACPEVLATLLPGNTSVEDVAERPVRHAARAIL